MPKISAQKRKIRRQQILAAAMRCFARNGFHRSSMEDIVRESKMSPGAIYCYFRGKNDIVAAIAEERHGRESALLSKLLNAKSAVEGVRELVRDFIVMLEDPEEKEKRKVTIQIWAESLRDRGLKEIVKRGLRQREALVAWLRRSQKKGEIRGDMDVEALSRVMLSLLQGFILQQAWEPGLDAPGFFRTTSQIIEAVITEKHKR